MSQTALEKAQKEIAELLRKPQFIGWTKLEQVRARRVLLELSRSIPLAIHDKKRILVLERQIRSIKWSNSRVGT